MSTSSRIPASERVTPRKAVFLLALGAAALRVAASGLRGDYLGFDESMYIILGRNLLTGAGYTLNGLPNASFPFLMTILAGATDLMTNPRLAVSLPSAVLGGAAVLPLYFLARRMASDRVALASAILFAGFPSLLLFTPFVSYGRRLYEGSEQIYIFFALFAAYFAYRAAEEGRWRDYVLGGVFAGAAFEVRQDGAAYAAVLCAWLVGAALPRFQWKRLLKPAAFAAAALAVALPFLVYVRVVTGAWGAGTRLAGSIPMRDNFEPVLARNDWSAALASLFALNDEGIELETPYYGVSHWHRRRIAQGGGGAGVTEMLAAARWGYLAEGARVFVDKVIPDRLAYAAIIGIAAAAFSARRLRNLTFLAVQLLPAALIALVIFPLARFWMYLAPFAVLLIGWGIMSVFELGGRLVPRFSRWAAPLGLAAVTLLSLYGAHGSIRAQQRYRADRMNFERVVEGLQLQAARWLFLNTAPGERVMASSPQAALLADREWFALPIAGDERVAAYAETKKADVVIVTVTDVEEAPAALEPFLVATFSGRSRELRVSLFIYDLNGVEDDSVPPS